MVVWIKILNSCLFYAGTNFPVQMEYCGRSGYKMIMSYRVSRHLHNFECSCVPDKVNFHTGRHHYLIMRSACFNTYFKNCGPLQFWMDEKMFGEFPKKSSKSRESNKFSKNEFEKSVVNKNSLLTADPRYCCWKRGKVVSTTGYSSWRRDNTS